MKALILESGSLINLSMNGLLDILPELKKTFNGKFLITQQIKQETVDRPLGVTRYELGALRVQTLIEKKVIELPDSMNISSQAIEQETRRLMDLANHSLQAQKKWIPIVSDAEISCIALCHELAKQNVETLIVIDERTTRMLAENPYNLGKLMSEKLHQRVDLIGQNFEAFSHVRFIRSAELVLVAYKKGLISLQGKKVLEALLYATKFKGCAISYEEIEELKHF